MVSEGGNGAGSPVSEHPVGLVTVSYRSGSVLSEMLRSAQVVEPPLAAIVIADNASEDDVREFARREGHDYLALENRGYGAAVNAAVAILPGTVEWVLITNPDVTLEPTTIAELLRVGLSDPHIAAVGPNILNEDGRSYPSARQIPSIRVGIGHAVFGTIWPTNPWTRAYKHPSDTGHDQTRDTGWLSGACLLVRREAFEQIGGFDEDYFMYFEDVDLGFRFGKAGYRNVYAPRALIVHSGGHSTSAESARMIDAHHASARLFLARKYPGTALAPLRGIIGIGLRARARILKRGV